MKITVVKLIIVNSTMLYFALFYCRECSAVHNTNFSTHKICMYMCNCRKGRYTWQSRNCYEVSFYELSTRDNYWSWSVWKPNKFCKFVMIKCFWLDKIYLYLLCLYVNAIGVYCIYYYNYLKLNYSYKTHVSNVSA